jgi:hypothetical protein
MAFITARSGGSLESGGCNIHPLSGGIEGFAEVRIPAVARDGTPAVYWVLAARHNLAVFRGIDDFDTEAL